MYRIINSNQKTCFIFGLILCIMLSLHLNTGSAYEASQSGIRINADRTMSVNVDDRSLKSVLAEIGDKAEIRILLYSVEDVPISRHFENMPLEQGLRNILEKRSVSFLYQADPTNTKEDSHSLKIVWVFDAMGKASELTGEKPQKTAYDEMDPMDREVLEDDEADHMTLARPEIKLNYELNSEEGFWVDRILSATDFDEKEEAIAELVNLDTDSAIEAIAVAFDEKDPSLRMYAVDSLAKSQNPLSDQLIGQAFLKDDDTHVAIKAANVLHNRDSLVAAEFLTEAYKGTFKNKAVQMEVLKLIDPVIAGRSK